MSLSSSTEEYQRRGRASILGNQLQALELHPFTFRQHSRFLTRSSGRDRHCLRILPPCQLHRSTLHPPLVNDVLPSFHRTHWSGRTGGNTSRPGLIAVRVLRSRDEDSFSNALPRTARNVRVFEGAPSKTALRVLHTNVLGSLVSSAASGDRPLPVVRSERIVPAHMKTLLDNLSALKNFISGIVPQLAPQVPPTSPSTQIIQFYSTLGTPLFGVVGGCPMGVEVREGEWQVY